MKLLLNGAGGFMGGEVIRAAARGYGDAVMAGGIEPFGTPAVDFPVAGSWEQAAEMFDANSADCLIDFSNHLCTKDLLQFALGAKLPLVIATTGHTEEELALIKDAAKGIPIFHSANMSVGVALLVKLAKTAAAAMPDADIEIIEKHHNQKLDVPSGTALALADAVKAVREEAEFVVGRHENGKRRKEEVGIHSLRLGGVVGEHEVIITTGNETISLKHEAHSRAVFADGGVMAAAYVAAQTVPGLYTMEDLVAACR